MYTKKSLRDNTDNSLENFLSSDFSQKDINSFIDNDVNRLKDKKKVKNWWKDEDESSDTSSILLGTGKNFMKSKINLKEKDDIPEIVVQNDIESFPISNADLRLDLNKSSDQSQTIYNETIKENESTKVGEYQHPRTFVGYTESEIQNPPDGAFGSINDEINEKKPLFGGETLKSNVTMLPVDESEDNFQESADFTKKDHLLSKVSLLDSFEDVKVNKSSIKYDDFVSTGASYDTQGNVMEGTGYSYKTSINPASGDSFNTQGITNITDTVLGDNTFADLAALHRQYEHVTKESFEPTANSNIQLSDTVKQSIYEDYSANNQDSTINTRSFGMKVLKFEDFNEEKQPPIPSPRKKKVVSRSNENEVNHSEYSHTIAQPSRMSDNCEKKKPSRYSHIQSSGYGSKCIAPPSRENNKISDDIQEKERSKVKPNIISNARSNLVQKNKQENLPHSISSNRSRSESSNIEKLPKSFLKNETYKIRRFPTEEKNPENNFYIEKEKNQYQNPVDGNNEEWHEKWLQERLLVKKLQSNSMIQERDFKRQIENITQQYERKISHLESQLARTKDQLNLIPDLNNKILGPNVTTEDIERIKKDIKAQELIVSAYEKDNEKLCEEMKILKLKQKKEDNIDSFENERLISQIASLKADLDSKEIEVRNLRHMAINSKSPRSNNNNDFYLDEIAQLKSNLQHLNKKYLSSESERQKLEMKLDKISMETEKMTNQYHHEVGIEKIEKEKLMELHKAEVDDLKRKIKWYLENQAILNKESKKMKNKDEEIANLKRQLDTTGSVKISSNIRAKERTVDIARIKQLEDENMSLKEDLYSLAKGKNIGNVATKRTVQFLEEKIKSLEEDLESNVSKENKSLRSLQQQFESTKHQYEETIRDMELDACNKSNKQNETERNMRIMDLKEKIGQMENVIQKKNSVINRLKLEMKKTLKEDEENKLRSGKNINRIEPENRTDILTKEIREKDIEIQRLQIQNDYLRSHEAVYRAPNRIELEAENAKLKSQAAHLTFELDNHRQALSEIKEVSLKNEQIIREESREEIRKCEEYHRDQLKNVKIDYVGRHSESENATLQSQTEVQKNYISHLQAQISEFSMKIKNYETRNDELAEAKKEIQLLKGELADLRLIWSNKPGLEMIDRLRSKVLQLEEKEALKGRQLDEYVGKVVKNSTKPYQEEVERWRSIVSQKNQNLLQVQNELNHLLVALEELRRQGITIPKIPNKFRLLSDNNKNL